MASITISSAFGAPRVALSTTTTTSGDDTLTGTSGSDTLIGGLGNDLLIGLAGDDRLEGGKGNDTLRGGSGRDRLEGGDGNDTLDASRGTAFSQGYGDYIRPGLGHDTILGHAFLWSTGEGADISYGDLSGIGGLTIRSGVEGTGTAVSGDGRVNDSFTYIHYFEGSQDGDLIIGSNSDRWEGFAPLGGADTIRGGGGANALNYSYEADYFGGSGSGILASIPAGTVRDTQGNTDVIFRITDIRGSDFGDRMTAAGAAADIRFRGNGGNDTLIGGAGADTLDGGDGNDILRGNKGRDEFYDGAGNDKMFGGAGNDLFYLNRGEDSVTGGLGSDTVIFDLRDWTPQQFVVAVNLRTGDSGAVGFSAGRDTFVGIENVTFMGDFDVRMTGNGARNRLISSLGDDTLFGGAGFDTLNGGAGNDTLIGGDGRDKAFMGAGNDLFRDNGQGGALGRDTVFGGLGNDTVQGGNGADIFRGMAGADRILGRLGNDTLDGGAGRDTMIGGAGADRFVFAKGYGVDLVTDFAPGTDELALRSGLWAGTLSAAQVVSQFASVSGGDVVFDFGGGDTLTLAGLTSTAGLDGDLILL